jgi:hypothetical protein
MLESSDLLCVRTFGKIEIRRVAGIALAGISTGRSGQTRKAMSLAQWSYLERLPIELIRTGVEKIFTRSSEMGSFFAGASDGAGQTNRFSQVSR